MKMSLAVLNMVLNLPRQLRETISLPSSFITTLAEDKDGMWFATRGAVSKLKYEDERWKTFTRDDGLAGDKINSIAVVGNYVWYGTDEGVSRLNKSTKGWDNFNASKTGLVSDDVTAVLVDGKYIWIGTKAGLNRYDDTTGGWARFSSRTNQTQARGDPATR